MSFAETMTQEIHQSRRDRSRRALFWAKLVGIALVLLTGAILRTQPDLRNALLDNGIDTVAGMMGATIPEQTDANQPTTQQSTAPQTSTMPRSVVRINRGQSATSTQSPTQTADTARALGETLSTRKAGN